MKKILVLITILFLFTTLVNAQKTDSNFSVNKIDVDGIASKIDDKLEEDIEVPESLQLLTRIGFGIEGDETITFSIFIILLGMWVFTLMLVWNAVKIIFPFPIFRGFLSWVTAVIITLIASSTGVIKIISGYWLAIGKLITKSSTFSLVISGILLIAIIYFTVKILSHFRKHRQEEKELVAADKAGLGLLRLRKEGEYAEKEYS